MSTKSQSNKKQPSVLFLNHVYPPEEGATGRVLSDLTHYLCAKDWRVGVISLTPDGQKTKQSLADPNMTHYPVKFRGKARRSLSAFFAILRLFTKTMAVPRHDIIVTMTDPPMLVSIGWLLSRLKGSRHVHWVHDLYPDLLPVLGYTPGPKTQSFFRGLSRRAMKRADKIVSIGRCMTKHLKHTGVETAKIETIPNWANLELYDSKGEHAIAEDNTPEDPKLKADPRFRILYAGSFSTAHAMSPLLKAIHVLDKTNPEIEFVFAGLPENFERLIRERDKHGWSNLRFLPPQPVKKLRALMKSGDVHLVSMKTAAKGMMVPCKFYSALASHRPCIFIGPHESEPAFVIRDTGCGVNVPPEDPQALVETIKRYRNEADLWFKGQEGAKAAAQTYSPCKSMPKFEALLQKVINA